MREPHIGDLWVHEHVQGEKDATVIERVSSPCTCTPFIYGLKRRIALRHDGIDIGEAPLHFHIYGRVKIDASQRPYAVHCTITDIDGTWIEITTNKAVRIDPAPSQGLFTNTEEAPAEEAEENLCPICGATDKSHWRDPCIDPS